MHSGSVYGQAVYSFNCCLPGNLYLYTQGSQTIQKALTKLKRGMALGTGLGVNIVNHLESKQSTSGTAAVPFMMTSDKSVNLSTDTMVNESIKKVKDTIKQDNKENLERTERVAVAFEKFGQNKSRSRNRSGDRDNRDGRRSSNDIYSRSPSRSPDRGGYDRRSYSPYRGNSGDRYNRYNDRYDRRDGYSRERSRSPGDYNSRGYRGRSNLGSRYQGSRQPSKKCAFCSRTGHPIEICWDFRNYLEKIGKQLIKLKDGQSNKRKNDEDSSDKVFVMQSVTSLLEDLGLGIDSTNF